MLKRHSITFHWLGDTGDCVYKSQMMYKPRVKPVRGKFPDKTVSYLEMPKFPAKIYIGGVYKRHLTVKVAVWICFFVSRKGCKPNYSMNSVCCDVGVYVISQGRMTFYIFLLDALSLCFSEE